MSNLIVLLLLSLRGIDAFQQQFPACQRQRIQSSTGAVSPLRMTRSNERNFWQAFQDRLSAETPKVVAYRGGLRKQQPRLSDDQKKIASLFSQWSQTLQAGDTKAMMSRYSSKALLIPSARDVPLVTNEDIKVCL